MNKRSAGVVAELMTLRRAQVADASSLALLSLQVWASTYLRQGINGFFADYALQEITQSHFARLIADPDEMIIVSQNTVGIDGFVRVTCQSAAPVAGCPDVWRHYTCNRVIRGAVWAKR